jgi:hypothetical protein
VGGITSYAGGKGSAEDVAKGVLRGGLQGGAVGGAMGAVGRLANAGKAFLQSAGSASNLATPISFVEKLKIALALNAKPIATIIGGGVGAAIAGASSDWNATNMAIGALAGGTFGCLTSGMQLGLPTDFIGGSGYLNSGLLAGVKSGEIYAKFAYKSQIFGIPGPSSMVYGEFSKAVGGSWESAVAFGEINPQDIAIWSPSF